ncbi:MAG: hypothetical protein IJK98_03030 [Clostridia bacterium]|nr:hypothetical protein [Clostridia bacterium]
MKQMKKTFSVFLVAALLLSALLLPGTAVSVYPESEHDYRNNCDETWTYQHPDAADGLFVTFSEDTYVVPGHGYRFLTGEYTEEEMTSFLENGAELPRGDFISVYTETGELYGTFTGDQLAGKTLYIAGSSFSIRLESDESETGYGFAVTDVSTNLQPGFAQVNYHIDDETCVSGVIEAGEKIPLNAYYKMRQTGKQIIIGWKTAQGDIFYYKPAKRTFREDVADITAEDRAVYDLYPVTCPIALTKDDVYSFLNDEEIFNAELDGYVYTNQEYLHLILDEYVTFIWTPLAPFVAPGVAYLTLYWPTNDFVGACTGIALTELLQYLGKLDLPATQGVETMAELEPTDELLSIINSYAVQALPGHLCNHMGIDPGTEEYSNQLKALYETVAAGNPVYFEFYPYAQHPMKTIFTEGPQAIDSVGHSILLTGAYTDDDGNHILIVADCNYPEYGDGTCNIAYINKDFTEIYNPLHQTGPLQGFSWTETAEQYDSLPAQGFPNPFSWHIVFFRNFFSFFKQILALFSIVR